MGVESSPHVLVTGEVKGKVKMVERLSYFALDGNYGDASGLTIIDTTDWTDADFDFVDAVDDESRPDFARLVSEWITGELPPEEYVKIFEARFGITEDDIKAHYGEIEK